MEMKLENIIKQVISEQLTPGQLLKKMFNNLGKKGAAEAESALIRVVRKENNLGPKVPVDIFNLSDAMLGKAIKSAEYKVYRDVIVQKAYGKTQQLFDDIVANSTGKKRVMDLNNAGIHPAFQSDLKNLSNLRRKSTTSTTTSTTTTTTTPINKVDDLTSQFSKIETELVEMDDYLWKRINKNSGLKRFFLLNRVSRSNWPTYRNLLFKMINEKMSVKFDKEIKLQMQEVKKFFETLDLKNKKASEDIIKDSLIELNRVLDEQSKNLGSFSKIFNAFKPDAIVSFKNYLTGKGTFSQFSDDYVRTFKITLTFMSFGTVGEILNGDLNSWEELKNELDLKYVTIPIPGLNVWTWGLNAIYRWGKLTYGIIKKPNTEKGKSGVFDDEDLKNNDGNKGVLDGIKDN
jgi:hypothetical protein